MSNKRYSWFKGIIKKKIGTVMYLIYVPELDCEITRHIDQIRSRLDAALLQQRDREYSDWDPDVVADAMDAPTDSDLHQGGSATTEGEIGALDEMQSHTANATTPAASTALLRRRAISPIFSTPTSGDDCDDDQNTRCSDDLDSP
jgi:hypothetical protein